MVAGNERIVQIPTPAQLSISSVATQEKSGTPFSLPLSVRWGVDVAVFVLVHRIGRTSSIRYFGPVAMYCGMSFRSTTPARAFIDCVGDHGMR